MFFQSRSSGETTPGTLCRTTLPQF